MLTTGGPAEVRRKASRHLPTQGHSSLLPATAVLLTDQEGRRSRQPSPLQQCRLNEGSPIQGCTAPQRSAPGPHLWGSPHLLLLPEMQVPVKGHPHLSVSPSPSADLFAQNSSRPRHCPLRTQSARAVQGLAPSPCTFHTCSIADTWAPAVVSPRTRCTRRPPSLPQVISHRDPLPTQACPCSCPSAQALAPLWHLSHSPDRLDHMPQSVSVSHNANSFGPHFPGEADLWQGSGSQGRGHSEGGPRAAARP